MQTIHIQYPLLQDAAADMPRQVIAIGDFDGVHRGHCEVIRRAVTRAKERQFVPSVLTFSPHPREVLGQSRYAQILTPLPDKLELFAQLGVERTYIVHFDEAFSKVSPQSFIDHMLLPLTPDTIVVGFDFRFGHRAEGNPDTMCERGQGQFTVEVVRPYYMHGEKVSSTRIREYMHSGKMSEANELLGRRYRLRGTVVAGAARGRTIGFPTANVELDAGYMIPINGVYAVYFSVDGVRYHGVMNIGVRPTFHEGETKPSLEVHIFHFDRIIYERQVEIELVAFIRPERRFASVSELQEQIRQDISQCNLLL